MAEPEFHESFEDYKEIIKELLFNGAERQLRTKEGKTALDLIKEAEKDGIEEDEYLFEKYLKLRGILIGNTDFECL